MPENVDTVRRFVELWSGKDQVAMARDDPGTLDDMRAFLTDDFELRFSTTVEQRTNHGKDAALRALMEWLEPWESYVQEADEFIEVGDVVVVTYRQWESGREVAPGPS